MVKALNPQSPQARAIFNLAIVTCIVMVVIFAVVVGIVLYALLGFPQWREGVRVLIDRYRSAGLTSISHDFYLGGRHEMLHETNRRDVITNLLVWVSDIVQKRP